MKDLESQTKGIRDFSKKRTELALDKVEKAIQELIELGETITKYKLLKRSDASRKFIYNNDLVDKLIEKYQSTPVVEEMEANVFKKEINTLGEENKLLKQENTKVKSLEKENERLKKNYELLQKEYEKLELQLSQVCQQKGLI